MDLAVRVLISVNKVEKAREYLKRLSLIKPTPNYDLEALILYNESKPELAKEKLKEVNPMLFTERYLKKRFDENSISQLKEMQQ